MAIRFRITHIVPRIPLLTAALLAPLAGMVVALMMTACGSETHAAPLAHQPAPTAAPTTTTPDESTPTALPDPPSIFSPQIDQLMPWAECHYERIAGVLERPRVGPYADIEYQSDSLTPGYAMSRLELFAWIDKHINPVLQTEVNYQCLEFAPSDAEWTDEIRDYVRELGRGALSILLVGLFSPLMEINCHEWQLTEVDNFQFWREGSVNRRGEQSGLYFDWHYGQAHQRILDTCAAVRSDG